MTDIASVKETLRSQRIETPSWGYGNSGHPVQGVPAGGRAPHPAGEDRRRGHGAPAHRRGADASPCTSRGTRSTTTAPWPSTPPTQGVALGTINANVFQDNDYRLGSVTNPDPGVRRKAIDHLLECVDVMDATGSRDLKLWFSDGTNYPGQDNIRGRQDRLAEALREVYDRLGDDQRMRAGVQAVRAGLLHHGRAGLGHVVRALPRARAQGAGGASTPATTRPGTNIEFIVAFLLRAGRLGAFDFNSRFYADDDLMVGAADPFQLFRIMHEIVAGRRARAGVGDRVHARPVPQHRGQDPGVIRSVMNVQEATAKALLVDADAAGGRAARRVTSWAPTPC